MKAYQVVGMELFIGCMKSITKDTRTGGKTLMVDFNAASAIAEDKQGLIFLASRYASICVSDKLKND